MDCPKCGGGVTVFDSRPDVDCVNRVRKCLECGHKFKTVEYEEEVWKREEKRIGMRANEYQALAMRTSNRELSKRDHLINGVLGLTGESGECADLVKKHLMQGHPLDIEHIAMELSDCLWYVAETATAIGVDMETIMKMNIDKLRKRYPEGFSAERSIHREKGDI